MTDIDSRDIIKVIDEVEQDCKDAADNEDQAVLVAAFSTNVKHKVRELSGDRITEGRDDAD